MTEIFDRPAEPVPDKNRQREVLRLRLGAPMRKPVDQDDVDGLELFDAHRSPKIL